MTIKYLLAILMLIMNVTCYANTFFAYKSEPGERAGHGTSKTFDEKNTQFTLSNMDDLINFIDVQVTSKTDDDSWSISLGALMDKKLKEGTYKNARNEQYSRFNPKLDVSSNSGGCGIDNIVGEFKILEIGYDKNQKTNKLAADFVQRCGNDISSPALYGVIRYHSSIPDDLEKYSKSFIEKTNMIFRSAPGDLIGYGVQREFSNKDKAYSFISTNNNSAVYTTYEANGDNFFLDFVAPHKQTLTTKLYDHTVQASENYDEPEMRVDGNGAACNGVGKFKVLQANFYETEDETKNVKNLAIDFVQHCNDLSSPALTGSIRYHSDVPINIDLPSVLQNDELDLPYVQIADHYHHIKLKMINSSPVLFKVLTIDNTSVKDDEIKVASSFKKYTQVLNIPLLNIKDIFGRHHSLTNVKLKSQTGGLEVGNVFALFGNNNDLKLFQTSEMKSSPNKI